MPAFGNALSPSETTALTRFLMTLRGNDLAPAVDGAGKLVKASAVPLPEPPLAPAQGGQVPGQGKPNPPLGKGPLSK